MCTESMCVVKETTSLQTALIRRKVFSLDGQVKKKKTNQMGNYCKGSHSTSYAASVFFFQ